MKDYCDDGLDEDIDDIISQIKNQGKTIKTVEKDKLNLSKEDIERFVIDNASSIVQDAVDMIQSLKIEVEAAPEAKLIESMAELLKATTAAIDSLSKLKLSDDKIKSQKELKQMDIDSKQSQNLIENNSSATGIFASREEILKSMAEVILDKNKTTVQIIEDGPIINV